MAVFLLLTGCAGKPVDSSSEVQPSQSDGSSSEELTSQTDPILATHVVSGIVTCNGHVMEVRLSVPENWDFDKEQNWLLLADQKAVVDFHTVNIYDEEFTEYAKFDWSETDKEYREYEGFVEDGWLNIPGMTAKYYVRRYEDFDGTIIEDVTCKLINKNISLFLQYLPSSGVSLEELGRYLATMEILEFEQ